MLNISILQMKCPKVAVITLISFSAVFSIFQRTSTLGPQYKSYEAARLSIDFACSVKQVLERVKCAYDRPEATLALVPTHSSFPFSINILALLQTPQELTTLTA